MNNNWNVNNRDRRGWRGHRGRGRGRGGRGSWPRNEKFHDQQTPYGNQNRGFRGGRGNFGKNKMPSRETPGKRLSEEEIGVTEYMSDHKGFNGIIKCRYSDFQVSEINESGEIAKLTDMSPPVPPMEETIEEDEDLLLSKYNLEILPMETWDRINTLIVNPPTDKNVEVDVTGMSKEERTKIHDSVKKAFGPSLVSSTVTIGDKKIVRFEKFKKGVRRDNRVKWVWPGEYVHFVLHKENCDTMEAAMRLAERLQLNIKPSMLGYAGTKDRRAKTTQWFSLRKVDPKKIVAAAKDVRDLYVGNFTFKNYNLRLGMLKGNRFRIALRNVTASDEVIDEACERLRKRGFINYYGLQRFGTRVDMPTYEIGRKLLQSNFREAVNSILQDRESSRSMGRATAGDARLQRALNNNPRDLVGALDQLPRNQRMMYLHSYQSLVWNRCVSRRLQLLGHHPVVGDLVPLQHLQHDNDPCEVEEDDISDDEKEDNKIIDESENSVQSTENNSVQTTDNVTVQEVTDNNYVQEATEHKEENKHKSKEQEKKLPKPNIPVKVLTEEDIASGRYSIFDIVMPIPGHNVEYPPNMKEYYKELVEKDNLKLDMIHKNKAYSLSGAYRHIAVRPEKLEWLTVRYHEPFCDLQLSDLQELNGHTDTGIVEDGKFKACLLTITLPASSYATMALRELLKVDTSNDSQAQQNNYFKSKTEDKHETEENKEEGEGESDSKQDKKDDSSQHNENDENNDNKGEKRKIEDETEVDVKKKKEDNVDTEK
ncbi:pseudouridylate synthase 7 homolog [Papilio machaon]|uniref:pseudouridylate synthase 7 homolog n=1 Tax=Papilio machaon TaxID=76193 RepID=UPI001E6641FB|nr:pseudouridylate synthase 7 homolog [Papilio machaon]